MTDTAPIPTVTATIEKDTDVASEGKAEIADLPKDDSGEKKETEGLSEDPKTCGKSTDSIDNDVLMTQTQGTMDAASSNAVDKEGYVVLTFDLNMNIMLLTVGFHLRFLSRSTRIFGHRSYSIFL